MPKNPHRKRLPNGVPKKIIDWKQVELGLMAQCPATEIAGEQGICVDTLYNRCIEDKGIPFSAFRQGIRQKGLGLLRKKQFVKAISGSGHSEMLKLLGVELLGQGQKKTTSEFQNLSDLAEGERTGKIDEMLSQPDGS